MKRTTTLTYGQAEFVIKHIPDSALKERLKEFVDDNQLFTRIERLLEDNEKDPCWIPTIKELGELKGGYSLVKDISEAGGLKAVRPEYARYLFNRLQAS